MGKSNVRAALTAALLLACATSEPVAPPVEDATCVGPLCDRARLDALGLDPFYQKLLDADGIPVVSSALVSDAALLAAREIVVQMLSARSDVHDAMIAQDARVGIMAVTEVTTDIPEHRFLANDPDVDWDTRARGLGGTPGNPITTAAEENLLCMAGDVYSGESILVHEFAHAIHLIGIDFIDPDFSTVLQQTYDQAVTEGLWAQTYAETNPQEYWAEGVQSWFDANQMPQPGIHNEVDTRYELKEADPRLAGLIGTYLPDSEWRPMCFD